MKPCLDIVAVPVKVNGPARLIHPIFTIAMPESGGSGIFARPVMDNPLGHEAALNLEEIDYAADDSAIEAPPEIGNDERRLHVRAYNHWASLLKDRSFPSIEDLEPADIEDFGPHSVILDLRSEGLRGGKGCVSTFRSGWSPYL